MNYFPFHIGDYAAHTAHLEPMEDLAYMRLLQQYYLREGPLPSDIQATAKLVRMRSMSADVESVLNEFFELTEAGWAHARCDAEIAKMQDKQEKARASGIASANARKAYAERVAKTKSTPVNENPTDVERSLADSVTDVQLPTPTPTPTPTPITIPGGGDAGAGDADIPRPPQKTAAVCIVLKSEGIGKVNPSHPTLAALLRDGADVGHFASVAKDCAARGKPDFAYVLATVKGQLADAKAAAEMAIFPAKRPAQAAPKHQSFATQDAVRGMLRWEEMTGQTHPDWHTVGGRPNQQTPAEIPAFDMGEVIEVQGAIGRITA